MRTREKIAQLIRILNKRSKDYPDWKMKREADEAAKAELIRIGKPAIPPILADLKRRYGLEMVLYEIEYPSAKAVLNLVTDKRSNRDSRVLMILLLHSFRNQDEILQTLLVMLDDVTEYPEMHAAAASVLAEHYRPYRKQAVELLYAMAKSPNVLERRYALGKLNGLTKLFKEGVIRKSERLFNLFMRAASDRGNYVRHHGVYGLTLFNDKRAIPILKKRLQDHCWFVGEQAGWALANLNDAESLEILKDVFIRPDAYTYDAIEAAVAAVGKLKVEYPRQVILTQPTNIALMNSSIEVLGEQKDVWAVEYLIPLLDEKYGIRLTAAQALGRIGDERAIEPLRMRLAIEDDQRVIGTIKSALRRFGIADAES